MVKPRDPQTTAVDPLRVAVIGAGISGLTCARVLQDAGHSVVVYDKARGPGGRMSTRRTDHGTFDHGAQYFTVRDPRFADAVERWMAAGRVKTWSPRVVRIGPDGMEAPSDSLRRVGAPGMSSLGRHLASGLTVHTNHPIDRLRRFPDSWWLRGPQRVHGPFDEVVLALPAPQAAALVPRTLLARSLSQVSMDPCLTLMLAFAHPLPVDFDAAFLDHPVLSWMARNTSKPQRTGTETWLLHAGPDWSRQHLEDPPETVAVAMTEAMESVLGAPLPQPTHRDTHRWRYARPRVPLAKPFLREDALALSACGDWCVGLRVEDAFVSGLTLGTELVTLAANRRPVP